MNKTVIEETRSQSDRVSSRKNEDNQENILGDQQNDLFEDKNEDFRKVDSQMELKSIFKPLKRQLI